MDTSFPAAGLHVVGLRATDNSGGTATATDTIQVGEAPVIPDDTTPRDQPAPGDIFDTSTPVGSVPPVVPVVPDVPVEPLRWLDPFPTVRIRGRTTTSGVRLSLFTVRAPAGSTVKLRCAGSSCTKKSMSETVKSRAAAGNVRFKRVERTLRAGTVLQVYVSQRGLVGKYTRFKIRRLALPVRTDRCLMPGSTKPVGCPRSP